MTENKFLYTSKKIAEYLDVSIPTLMRFMEQGAPVAKDEDGNEYWTTTEALNEWYNERLKGELRKKSTIEMADLPSCMVMKNENVEVQLERGGISLPEIIEEIEKKFIMEALKKTNWHRENAASLLGISRKMLGDRIYKYDLKR